MPTVRRLVLALDRAAALPDGLVLIAVDALGLALEPADLLGGEFLR